MTTGFVWDERYMWWDTRHGAAFMPAGGWLEPGEHAENPSTKRRFKNLPERHFKAVETLVKQDYDRNQR